MKHAKYMSKLLYEYATSTSAQNNGDQVEDDGQSEFSTEFDSDEDGHNMSEALTAQTTDPVWVPWCSSYKTIMCPQRNASKQYTSRMKCSHDGQQMYTASYLAQ